MTILLDDFWIFLFFLQKERKNESLRKKWQDIAEQNVNFYSEKQKNINSWMQTQMFYIFYRLFKFISFLYQDDFLDLQKKRLHFNFQSGERKRSKMKLENF
jgi:hypothetical protein